MNSNLEQMKLAHAEQLQRAYDEKMNSTPDVYDLMSRTQQGRYGSMENFREIDKQYGKIGDVGRVLAHTMGNIQSVGSAMGSMLPMAQSALFSLGSVKQQAENAALIQQKDSLANYGGKIASIGKGVVGGAIAANVVSGLLGKSIGLSTPFGAGAMIGLGALSFIAKKSLNKKYRTKRQQYKTIQRRYSSAPLLEQQMVQLQSQQGAQVPTSDPQMTQVHMMGQMLGYLQLLTAATIPATGYSMYPMLLYEHLVAKDDKKGIGVEDTETDFMDMMYGGGYNKSGLSKSLDKVIIGLDNIQNQFNPIQQMFNFVTGQGTPGKIESPYEEQGMRDYVRSIQIAKGIGSTDSRLMLESVDRFAQGDTWEAKMLSLTMAQTALLQLNVKESVTMRHGMGIAKNAFNQVPDYEEGVFGKVVFGVENAIKSIPGLSALYNITKGVLTLPMMMSNKATEGVAWLKKALFGQEFIDIQDTEELDKRLGLFKSEQEKAYDFMGKGLPTELKTQTIALYEQLAVLRNTYDVINLMYQIQSQGEVHKFADDYYKKEQERTYWDPVKARYVDEETVGLLADDRARMRADERERTFSESGIGKLTNMFEALKSTFGGVSKATSGEITDFKGLFDYISNDQKTDDQRLKYSSDLFNMLSGLSGSQDVVLGDTDARMQKEMEMMQMMPTTGLQDQLFSVNASRAKRQNQDGVAGKIRRGGRSAIGGILGTTLALAGGSLPGFLLPLLAGGAGGIYGGLETHNKRIENTDRFMRMGMDEFKDVKFGSGRIDPDNPLESIRSLSDEQRSSKIGQGPIFDVQKLKDITKGDSEKQTKILEELQKGSIILQEEAKIGNVDLERISERTDQIHEIMKSGVADEFKETNKILTDILAATRAKGSEALPIHILTGGAGDEYLKEIRDELSADDYGPGGQQRNPLQDLIHGNLNTRLKSGTLQEILSIILGDRQGEDILDNQRTGTGGYFRGTKPGEKIPPGIHVVGESGTAPELIVVGKDGKLGHIVGADQTDAIRRALGVSPMDLPSALGGSSIGFADGTGNRRTMMDRMQNARESMGRMKDSAKGMMGGMLGGGGMMPYLMGAAGLGLGAMTGGLGFGLMAGMSGLGLGFTGQIDKKIRDEFEKAEQTKKAADPNYQIQKWEDREKKGLLDKIGYKGVGALGGIGAMLLGGPLMGMAGSLVGGMLPGFLPGALVSGVGTGLGALMGPLAPLLGAAGAIAWMLKNKQKATEADNLAEIMEKVNADKEKEWETLNKEQKLVRLANEQHELAKMQMENDMFGFGDSTMTKALKMAGGATVGLLAGGPLGMLWGLGAGGISSWLKGKSEKDEFMKENGIQYILEGLQKGKKKSDGSFTPYKEKDLNRMYIDSLGVKEELVEMLEKEKSDDAPRPMKTGGLIRKRDERTGILTQEHDMGNRGEIIAASEGDRVVPASIFEQMLQWSKLQYEKLTGIENYFVKSFADKVGDSVGQMIPIVGPLFGAAASMLIEKGVEKIDFEKHLPTFTALYNKLKPRQHGGPIDSGEGYLVGEAGPEMILPRGPGEVIPATIFSEMAQYLGEIMDDTAQLVDLFKNKKGFSFSLIPSWMSIPDIKGIFGNMKISMPNFSMPEWKNIFNGISFKMPSFSVPEWMKIFKGDSEGISWFKFPKFSLPDFKKMFSFEGSEGKSWFSFPKIGFPDFKKLFSGQGKEGTSFFKYPKELLDSMKEGAKKFWNTTQSAAIKVWDDIGAGAKSVWGSMKTGASGMWDSVTKGGDRFMKVLEGWNPMAMMDKLGTKMSGVFKDVTTKIGDMLTFKGVRGKIGNLFKSKSQKSDEAVQRQEIKTEEEFWSGNLYWLEKIYHRLGGGSSTAGKIVGGIGKGIGGLFSGAGRGISNLLSEGGEGLGNLMFDAQFKARGMKKKLGHKLSGLSRTMGQELSELKDKAKEKFNVDYKTKVMGLIERIAGNTDELENAESDKQNEEKKGKGILGWLSSIGGTLGMLAPVIGGLAFAMTDGAVGGKVLGKTAGGLAHKAGTSAAMALNAAKETKAGGKVASMGTSVVEKVMGMMPTAGKAGKAAGIAGKGLAIGGKIGLKAIKQLPLLGLLIGVGFSIKRLMEGDLFGALVELASGAATQLNMLFPGSGLLLSLALDGFLLWRDMKNEEPKKPTKNVWETISDSVQESAAGIVSHIPIIGGWLGNMIMGKEVKDTVSDSGWIRIMSDEEINKGVMETISQHPVIKVAKYIGNQVGDWFGEKWESFKGEVVQPVVDIFNDYIWNPLKASFNFIKDTLVNNPITQAIMEFANDVGEVFGFVGDTFGNVFKAIKDIPSEISKMVAKHVPGPLRWLFGLESEGEGFMDKVDKDLVGRKFGERGTNEMSKIKKQKMLDRLKTKAHPDVMKKIGNDPNKLFDLLEKGVVEEHFFGPYTYTLTSEEMEKIKQLNENKMYMNLKNEKDRTRLRDMKEKMSEDAFKLLGGQPDNFQTLLEDGKIKKRFWSIGDFYELTDKGKDALNKIGEHKPLDIKLDTNKFAKGPNTIQTESGIKVHRAGAYEKQLPKAMNAVGSVAKGAIADIAGSDAVKNMSNTFEGAIDQGKDALETVMDKGRDVMKSDVVSSVVDASKDAMGNIKNVGTDAVDAVMDTSVGAAAEDAYNKGKDLLEKGTESVGNAAELTKDKLGSIAKYAKGAVVDKYYNPLMETMEKHQINTPLRQSHFLAQLMHESGSFKYSSEIASGANYEGRKDLGNTQPGDGTKFKGRGLIQLTGRANYKDFGNYVGKDLLENPEIVASDPKLATEAAGWYWDKKNLNKHADQDDISTITRRINGGFNGLDDRMNYLKIAKNQIGVGKNPAVGGATQSSDINKQPGPVTLPGIDGGINLGGGFKWPSKHNTIVSPFGSRKVKKGSSNHKGIDIRARMGDPVFASLPGKVAVSKLNPWGNVTLDHGKGLQTRYIHNSAINVKAGDSVNAGDQIANAGGSGKEGPNSYTPHLHFEVLKGGRPVDPELFVHSLNPGWSPKYSGDIDNSRQLSSKLSGKHAPGKTEKEAGGFDIFGQMMNMSKNVLDSGMESVGLPSIEGVKGYDWISDVKDMMTNVIGKVGKFATDAIRESSSPKKEERSKGTSGYGKNSANGNKTTDGGRQFTTIDPYLDQMIMHLFDNVANAFVTGVSDYSFTTTTEHSLY